MKRSDTSPYDSAAKFMPAIAEIAKSIPRISPRLVRHMQKLGEEFEEIRHSTQGLVPKLVRMYRSKYAYHTIALEGNTLSLGETELVIEHGMTIHGKSLREHLEAKNIPDALNIILDIAKRSRRPIELSDLLDIHKLAMKGIDESDPGQFRKGFVGITGTPYIPPPSYEIQPMLEAMLTFIDSTRQEKNRIKHIETAFKAHLWFVTIHPFYDGNGRVARLLAGLILLRGGYPPVIIRNEHRNRYNAAIREAQLRSNLRPYYEFMSHEFISTLTSYIISAKQESAEDLPIPLADAARPYGLEPEYLGLLARTGGISAFKEGKLWYIRRKDIEEYVRKRSRRQLLHQKKYE